MVTEPLPVAVIQASETTSAGTWTAAATSSGACARRAGPRNERTRRTSSHSTPSATATPRDALQAVDRVGDRLLLRDETTSRGSADTNAPMS